MSRDFSVTLSDFQKRFARLLDKSFCSMDYKLAMRNAFTYMKLLRVKNLEHRSEEVTIVVDCDGSDEEKEKEVSGGDEDEEKKNKKVVALVIVATGSVKSKPGVPHHLHSFSTDLARL
nr:hypothetical protein Itr_chr14CG12440 [Ipomoea trifida]